MTRVVGGPSGRGGSQTRLDRIFGLLLALLAGLLVFGGCAGEPNRTLAAPAPPPQPALVAVSAQSTAERLQVSVLAAHPHDPAAFTQGLLLQDGYLYESTGLEGRSSVRQVDPQTGAVIRQTNLDPNLFGEGLARVGDRLIQITWQNHVALVYDIATLEKTAELPYDGEGWGLCTDGDRLVMSDGSSLLTFRNPNTFEVLGALPVSLDGNPLTRLNELECVGDAVYANVWFTDNIVRIDKQTGQVTAVVNASNLLRPEEKPASPDGVLNGIAYDPGSDTFFVTGKLWPELFEARFVAQ